MTQTGQKAVQRITLPGTTIGGEVGIFSVDFSVRHKNGDRLRALNGVVDTGSSFVIIPGHILEDMGVAKEEQATFQLADGSAQDMFLGETLLDLQGRTRTVQVVFGPDSRKVLLGAMAVEAFGLAADAKNHRLIPAELML